MKSIRLLSLLLFVLPCTTFGVILNPVAKWKFQADGPIRGGAAVGENEVYFASEDGNLYAVKKSSGELIWKYQTSGTISSAPLIHDNMVIVQSRDNYIYAVNGATGALVWKYQMRPDMPTNWSEWEYFQSDPIAEGNTILVGSGDSYLYALSPQGKLKWEFKTGGRIRTAPLVKSNVIYQPSNNGIIYAIDFTNGKLLWQFETEGVHYDSEKSGWDRNSIDSSPRIDDSLLFLGSRDGFAYAVNIHTHKLKWKFGYGGSWAMTTPAIANTTVYLGWSDVHFMTAIDIPTGKEKWKFKAGMEVYSDPLIEGDEIIFGSADGKVYSVDKTTGNLKWQYQTSGKIYSPPAYDGTSVYIGNDQGQMYAISEGPRPNLAVFCPISKSAFADEYVLIDQKIVPYLKEKGFAQLDTAMLQQFMEARIADGNPSVIVFAYNHIPVSLVGKDPAQGTVRKYLAAGGKIIWPADSPNTYKLNKNDEAIGYDRKTGGMLLDVDFVRPEGGNFYSKATQEGRNWGLPHASTYSYAQVGMRGIVPLAIDGYGRATVWMRKFSPRPSSGFISFRPMSWKEPMNQTQLDLLYTLAMYGLD